MSALASIPNWVFLIVVFSAIGPMMRMIFGEHYTAGRRRKRFDKSGTEEVARLDAALAERDTVIEDLQRRLSEMESRLDFTERMLARPRDESEHNAGV
ncbi:MAG TPA: hypothetical protein VIP80_13910 [Gemmatimonadales bacterium]|jgi:hypothetical protein